MSRADGQRHWRRVRCEGCAQRCRYDRFRIFPGLRRGQVFREIMAILRGAATKYKRRGTLLGTLHAMKREAWERETAACRAQAESVTG